jgi:hypothetical protein
MPLQIRRPIPDTRRTVEENSETGLLEWIAEPYVNSARATDCFDRLLAEIRAHGAATRLTDADLAEADDERLFTDPRA